MNFRLTSGEKKSKKIYRLQRTVVKFQGKSWGVVWMSSNVWIHFLAEKPENTLLSFKRQKRTQLIRIDNEDFEFKSFGSSQVRCKNIYIIFDIILITRVTRTYSRLHSHWFQNFCTRTDSVQSSDLNLTDDIKLLIWIRM